MKIKRSALDRIVLEETSHWIGAALLFEKARENDEKAKKAKEPPIQGADKDSEKRDPAGPGAKEPPGKPGPTQKKDPKVPLPPDEGPEGDAVPDLEVPEQPAEDDALAQDAAEDEPSDDPKAKASEKISDVLVGKTIQSFSEEPESKLLPGAQEIVITFDQITDPLRILITKTGKKVYHFRGSVHNML